MTCADAANAACSAADRAARARADVDRSRDQSQFLVELTRDLIHDLDLRLAGGGRWRSGPTAVSSTAEPRLTHDRAPAQSRLFHDPGCPASLDPNAGGAGPRTSRR